VILGIESSCDDTAAAIVRGDGHVLAHKIASQVGKLVLAGIQIASQVGKLILAGIHKRRAKKSDQYRELHRNVISKCLLNKIVSQVGKLVLAGIHKRRAKKFDQYRELHRNVISKCLLTRLCLRWGSYYWQASTKEGQRSLINIGSCTGM